MKTHYLVAAICSAVLPWIPAAMGQTSEEMLPGWRPLVVEAAGDTRSSVLALTRTDQPVIAYRDFTNKLIKVASRNGSTWTKETVGPMGSSVALALHPQTDAPAVAWANDKMHFSAKTSGGWVTNSLERGGVQSFGVSLAYDPNGSPAVTYFVADQKAGGLKFAWREGPVWKSQVIHSRVPGYAWASLAFDSAGNAAILFTDTGTTWALATGRRSATGFSWETEGFPELRFGGNAGIAFDTNGNLMVAQCAPDHARFYRRSGLRGAWEPVTALPPLLEANDSQGLWECTMTVSPLQGKVSLLIQGNDSLDGAERTHLWVATASLGAQAPEDWQIHPVETGPLDYPPMGGYTHAINATGSHHLSFTVAGDVVHVSEDPTYAGPSVAFSDDMENSSKQYPDKPWPADPNGWTTEGNESDRNVTKQNSTPTLGQSDLWKPRFIRYAHPERISFFYGHDVTGGYDTGFRNWGRLKSREIDLTDATRAELKVTEFVHLEGGSFENGEIQISTNNGQTWTTISAKSRSNGEFQSRYVGLNGYLGQKIRLGFFVDTKNEKWNTYEGWYVDDVSVKVWNQGNLITE